MKSPVPHSYKGGFLSVLVLISSLQAATPAVRYEPRNEPPLFSPAKIAVLDFMLPGYGTYVQNKTGFAAIYFGANLVNLSLIYMAYRNWRFYESAYQAAALRQAAEPDKLYFQDPSGGDSYLSLQDIKNRAERGQLFFAISIVANVVIRSFSAWHSWSLADETMTRSGPRYEFYPEGNGGMRSQAGYYFYF